MRCYMCDGRGMRYDGFQNLYRTCEKCGGSGIAEPLTNEEWLRQASTEQLAREIANHIFVSCTTNKAYSNPLYAMVLHDVVEWLKEKHDDK